MKTKKIYFLIGFLISIGMFFYFYLSAFVPCGNDIYGHLYKMNFLTKNIKMRNFYPLYDENWYNGFQIFRYWPVCTYYILAIFNLLLSNDFQAYYLFLSFTFLLSFLGWYYIGVREKKKIYFFIGYIYWFLPDNIRVIFNEGNLARVLIFSFLPLFFYFMTNLIFYKKSQFVCVLMVFILTSIHFMLAAMCAVIFSCYGFIRQKGFFRFQIPITFFLGFLVSSVLLLPGLTGGVVNDTNSASLNTMRDWSQSLLKSLSVIDRTDTVCSFGISVLFITVLCLLKGKQRKGCIVAVLFFILTSNIFSDFVIQLPLSQVWWMTRFIQMCYILILYEFGQADFKWWKYAICFLVIILDILPSYNYFITQKEFQPSEYLLDQATNKTDSRLCIVDESQLGSYPSYYIEKQHIKYMQGWAIQGATTKSNIISITESMENGFYDYSFQNILKLGCDTVLVYKPILTNFNENTFKNAYQKYGYDIVDENEVAILLDLLDIKSTFGTDIKYPNLAIGSSSIFISYYYSDYQQGRYNNIEKYDIEELKQYKNIYLSGITYSSVSKLEKILTELNNSGVHVIVDLNNFNVNSLAASKVLGIESKTIILENVKNIHYNNEEYIVNLPYQWITSYILEEDEKNNFVFVGKPICYLKEKENITFMGLNLPYLYYETKNVNVKQILDKIMYRSQLNNISVSKIPITITYSPSKILVETQQYVNTGISYQDNLINNSIIKDNNQICISNSSELQIIYKHITIGIFKIDIILSLIGIILASCFAYYIKKEK